MKNHYGKIAARKKWPDCADSAEIKSPALQEKSAEIKQESSKAGDFQRMGIWQKIPTSGFYAENQLRPAVLGRKNFLFFGSEEGGKNAAVLISLAVSCRNLGINFSSYLQEILPQLSVSRSNSQLKALLPHNYHSSGKSQALA